MTQNGSSSPRSGVAVAVAAAAVTLATGLTVGALTGYIAPPRERAAEPQAPTDPQVVFVPVRPTTDPGAAPAAPTADPAPAAAAEPEVVYANQETRRHHEEDEEDEHEGREHEGDDD